MPRVDRVQFVGAEDSLIAVSDEFARQRVVLSWIFIGTIFRVLPPLVPLRDYSLPWRLECVGWVSSAKG